MPSPEPAAYVQFELAPESLRLPSFPPATVEVVRGPLLADSAGGRPTSVRPRHEATRGEVQVKTRVDPNRPKGVSTRVERRDCPDPFFAAAEAAAMRWCFHPLRPEPHAIQFELRVVFKGV